MIKKAAEDLEGQKGQVPERVRDEGCFSSFHIHQDFINVPVSSKWANSYSVEVKTSVLEMQRSMQEEAFKDDVRDIFHSIMTGLIWPLLDIWHQ